MGKPRMIILVRHAQSEGNKNRDIHQTIPDHRVKLTAEGHRQAHDAGRRLRDLLQPDDKLHFFTSPYRRTRETTEGIIESLTSDTPAPSPFQRQTIKVYEEPRLREQDFGNFQPCSTEMERMWMERADYGHFFYRIPNGESAADAYDRVSGFNESLWRQFGEDDFANVCVLVTHGLMARVFLMKWYHWSVEYFEDLRNINHCEFLVLTHNPENGKYTLQNKLRTWSDLRKERERENASKGQVPPVGHVGLTDHIPIRRKWGGCPDGCTHGMTAERKQLLRANLLNSMRHEHGHAQPKHTDDHASSFGSKLHKSISIDEVVSSSEDSSAQNGTSPKLGARHVSNPQHPLRGDENGGATKQYDSGSEARPNINPLHPKRPNLHGLNRNSEDHLPHLPHSTSSSSAHLKYALLHLGGRDGGGSMSGANSLAPSDDEGDDHVHHRHAAPTSPGLATSYLSHANQQHFEFPPSEQTQRSPPSQELEDDGDDEMSGNPIEKLKKHRLHHPHHHHHHHHHNHHHVSSSTDQSEHRMANILGDGDESSNHAESQRRRQERPSTDSPSHLHIEELSLEEQQKQDQSIQGSIY